MRNFTKLYRFVVVIIFCCSVKVSAQLVIGKPSFAFFQACASPSFNSYNISFTFSPDSALLPTNQFIIELSDASGSFTSPVVVYTSAQGAITSSPANNINFSFPTDVSGEAYRLRVRSTAPAATSVPSNAFPAYYKIQDEPFTINNYISTGAYCAGGSYLLTIDNPGGSGNNSPLQYPSLTFNWFKVTGPTTFVQVGTGDSFLVSEAGTYYCETNYGTCSSNSYSNQVTISESTSSTTSEISSSLGNPYCASQGSTTLSTINAVSYQWFKEGVVISGATNQTYVTNEPGNYSVNINLGNCSTNASINLENSGFSSSIDVDEFNTINEGETLTVTVTTDAISPTFEWYLNNVIISGATTNSYEASQTGNYKVVISQTSGCVGSAEHTFSIREPFPDVPEIPNLISPNGDGTNDTWIIPQQYVNGVNAKVTILTAQGKIVFQTNDYQNDWPQEQIDFIDVNPVYYYIIETANNQTRKGSITVVK